MPDVIVLKIIPTRPTLAATFAQALRGLKIIAYDLSVQDSLQGVEIGTASGVAAVGEPLHIITDPVPGLESSIIQNFLSNSGDPPTLKSVAAAIIVVNPPPGLPSRRAYDLRLKLERNGLDVIDSIVEHNVQVHHFEVLSPIQQDYLALESDVYIQLPASNVIDETPIAFVPLPANGLPPDFHSLLRATNAILGVHVPDDSFRLEVRRDALTPAQARQIAASIVWNRSLNPPPKPRYATESFEELYTIADERVEVDSDADEDRKKFEARLLGYHSTHDAEVLRLAGYIYAASTAIFAERASSMATVAEFTIPVDRGTQRTSPKPTTFQWTSVLLSGTTDISPTGRINPLIPAFTVPAAYFYVLSAMYPFQVSHEQRYNAALVSPESQLRINFQTALNSGLLSAVEAPVTLTGPTLNADQAARRIVAIGTTAFSLPKVVIDPPISALVEEWLGYSNGTPTMEGSFWRSPNGAIIRHHTAYLNLLLHAIVEGDLRLVNNIITNLNVNTIDVLVQITDITWTQFFTVNPDLLPEFTKPGSISRRVESFLHRLRKFFHVPRAPVLPPAQPVQRVPSFGIPTNDALGMFVREYNQLQSGGFSFAAPLDPTAMEVALHVVFPTDANARSWLKSALETIRVLYQMTDIGKEELHFSLMEAMYARGFTSAHSVHRLNEDDFQMAMTGTIAYPHAKVIHARTLALGHPAPPIFEKPQLGFTPVNPDGTLTDCIPPPNLSPLGSVQYLHELLKLDIGGTTIGEYISRRRGPVGILSTTMANLETPIPTIDIVIESLESLGCAPIVACGAVYDTNTDNIAGFNLSFPHDPRPVPLEVHNDKLAIRRDPPILAHDAATIFKTIPEHSSPATPVKRQEVYETLKQCFTSPYLPYSQPLDICRTYLEHIGTTRFDTMRHFRQEITELAIDKTLEPTDFQAHLWRFPVRLEIALEFLNITPEEYAVLYTGKITPEVTLELYGLPSSMQNWRDILLTVFEFLKRTGLTYPQFLEIWRSGYVLFEKEGGNRRFPDCEPCNLRDIRISFGQREDHMFLFRKLATFIRLWRSLKQCRAPSLTFFQLSDICQVLCLFINDQINSDFIRQLAALAMLRYYFGVPLSKAGIMTPEQINSPPEKRNPLLALWVPPARAHAERQWAITMLLDQVEDYARHRYSCPPRGHGFKKELHDNLDKLSRLSGFTHVDPWHAKPTSTLRFVEILAKIYASEFTIGEISFLFTTDRHIHGDDPLPLAEMIEVETDPLSAPDTKSHDLWSLRKKLLSVQPDEEELQQWTWKRILKTCYEFGYPRHMKGDPLKFIGEHFFPKVLGGEYGKKIPREKKRFVVHLPSSKTSGTMWNAPHHGPFHYDFHEEPEQLWIELPLRDEDVLKTLSSIRQLNVDEEAAIRELYFAPRAALAPFASFFSNFNHAVDYLIHEPSQSQRFEFFRREYVTFYHRCRLIAEHLAEHVAVVTYQRKDEGHAAAWEILRHMLADENLPARIQPWEDDSGEPPHDYLWNGHFSGTAFGAIVGLIGTGLIGEYLVNGRAVWREVSGELTSFGEDRNHVNAPVPTILPSVNFELSVAQQQFAAIRNGFAMRDIDGETLGGAQPYTLRWSGALLVETAGEYEFCVGGPTPGNNIPDFEFAKNNRWLISLQRGQKFWTIVNHSWHADEAPDSRSVPLFLRRGTYHIEIHFEQNDPKFRHEHCIKPIHAGFQVKYTGPDTKSQLIALPIESLFLQFKTTNLGQNLSVSPASAAGVFLNSRYTSTIRDIRRTYQRAFKALLYAHRHRLTAKHFHCDHENELRFLLEHQGNFLGSCYYRIERLFKTHHAYFNLNFLPVTDHYFPPEHSIDLRAHPTAKRQAALFDWWERKFDYCDVRRLLHDIRCNPLWLLFEEAHMQQPPKPDQLLRYLDVDISLSPLLLNFFAKPLFNLKSFHFGDERGPIRIWHCGLWIKSLKRRFSTQILEQALPALWAADDPNFLIGISSGNQNLSHFVHETCFASGEPRSYKEVRLVNNDLRKRARAGLLVYLCGMNRVPLLPFKGPNEYAQSPHDLTDLLLHDVEVGFGETTSRIHEALTAVHNLVQRARLGLERSFKPTSQFLRIWDMHFASFQVWEGQKRREVYRENWIEWEDIHDARQSESFQLLEAELRRSTLSIPRNGGLVWWSNETLPSSAIIEIQSREMASLSIPAQPPLHEQGLQFLGNPDYAARLSWTSPPPAPEAPVSNHVQSPTGTAPGVITSTTNGTSSVERLPLWIRSAIRMGTRFIRVSAAGLPPASVSDPPNARIETWCTLCNKLHVPGIDEYFFWLSDSSSFEDSDALQNADVGVISPDPTSDLSRPLRVSSLVRWGSRDVVFLNWSRVHLGQFDTPRRSDEGIPIRQLDPASPVPQLAFFGRQADTLQFGPIPSLTNATFRFDMATDSTVVVTPLTIPFFHIDMGFYPRPLQAYPFFIYFQPGAPLLPPSAYSIAFAVAAALRSHSRFESALKWYEVAFNPLDMNNSWNQSRILPLRTSADDAEDVTCCTDDPRSLGITRGRAVLLNYLEVLSQWGDSLLSKKSQETTRQALIIYDLIEKLLGRRPKRIHTHDKQSRHTTVDNFVPASAPLNPRLLNLYEQAADRLSLVHHSTQSQCLSDQSDSLSFYADPTNQPSIQVRHPYRFSYLLKRALKLTDTVKELGSSLLAAFEKGDAEYLAALHATHHRQLEQLRLEIRKNTWRESDWQVQALERSMAATQTRLSFVQNLIANGLNSGENGFMVANDNSMAATTGAITSEGIAQGLAFAPDMWFGVKGHGGKTLDYRQAPIGSKLSANFATAARLLNAVAAVAESTASQETKEGVWARRHDLWNHEVDGLTIEVQQIERQIYAAHRQRDISYRELNNHQRSIDHAIEAQNFMRDKFTKHDLYLFFQQETAALYRQTFDLAMDSARLAQRMFHYERCNITRNFLPDHVWDSMREGLLAGERLELTLRTMQNAYEDTDDREYELTKHISLRSHFPAAFLFLKLTGTCEIDIPEWMFDLDYPGQYMRRIKNVSLTIPCVKDQYVGVHCRLQLARSTVRINSTLRDPTSICGRRSLHLGTGTRRTTTSNGYNIEPNDPRVKYQYGATESIATSSGQNDSGTFELKFQEDRYLPFECAGAVSRWQIDVPQDSNQFDLDTLSDVVMHLNYTARDGGDILRRAASETAHRHLPGDGLRLFELRHDFPEAWTALRLQNISEMDHRDFILKFSRNMFPFLTGNCELRVTRLDLFLDTGHATVRERILIDYFSQDHVFGSDCVCDTMKLVNCIATPDWPGVFHGVLRCNFSPIGGDGHQEFGRFRFPVDLRNIQEVYLLCRYEVFVKSLPHYEHHEKGWGRDYQHIHSEHGPGWEHHHREYDHAHHWPHHQPGLRGTMH